MKFTCCLLTIAMLAMASSQAVAAGPFDGSWVIDVPAAPSGTTRTDTTCPALRLPVKITDNQVTGSLERVPSIAGTQVESGTGRASAQVKGTVQADGAVTAEWEGYKAAGRLAGEGGTVTIQGQCGPRNATATRVAK